MKTKSVYFILAVVLITGTITYQSCRSARMVLEYRTDTIYTNREAKGDILEVRFRRGSEHNHPLMAVWVEDTSGRFIQTLYVAESIAKGVFGHGDKSTGKWLPGPIQRPAALPVWSHSRGVREANGLYVPTSETPIADAYTGATPPGHFVLIAKTDNPLPDAFYVYFEINQTWDWNFYWTNNRFPDDENYKTSCQPALVYRTLVTLNDGQDYKKMELVGHSSYNGENGQIFTNLDSITTAKDITESVSVKWIR